VAGQHVAEFVPDDEPGLLGVHQVQQAGRQHDERLVRAQRHRVDHGVLRDEQLGDVGQVQDVAAVQHRLVQLRELLLGRLDPAGQEHQPQAAVAEQRGETAEQHVEARQLTQRDQRGAVGWVLVSA
jgi:hypothetical protein